MRCGKPLEDETMQYCYSCKNNQHLYEQGKAAFVYNRSMKSSIARLSMEQEKNMEGTMLLNLQKNMKAGLKKQGHRHLYRFLYIKRDIKKEAIIRQRSLQII